MKWPSSSWRLSKLLLEVHMIFFLISIYAFFLFQHYKYLLESVICNFWQTKLKTNLNSSDSNRFVIHI